MTQEEFEKIDAAYRLAFDAEVSASTAYGEATDAFIVANSNFRWFQNYGGDADYERAKEDDRVAREALCSTQSAYLKSLFALTKASLKRKEAFAALQLEKDQASYA